MNEDQSYLIGAFAKLTGVTERTLRYYDRVKLLKPSKYTPQGHRLYTNKDLFTLQKIITMKFMDFSLEEIAKVIHNPEQSLLQTLTTQEAMLQKKKEHLERVTAAIHRVKLLTEEEEEEIDSGLLLMLIHMVQHEEEQQQWLTNHISESFSDMVFMKDKSDEERNETEHRITSLLLLLKKYCKEGHAPADDDVQEVTGEILHMLLDIIGPSSLEEMSKTMMEATGDDGDIIDWKAPDPFLFPDILNAEEDVFLAEAFEVFNNRTQILDTLIESQRTEMDVLDQEVKG